MKQRRSGTPLRSYALSALCALTLTSVGCGTQEDTGQDSRGIEEREGTVRAALATLFSYTASNTQSATMNTVNGTLTLTEGQTITVGTCGLGAASFSGDTYLRLYGPSGTEVASNDDACGGTGSNFTYTVPAGAGGDYQVRAGCFSGGSCTGTVAWDAVGSTPPPPPPTATSFGYNASNTAYGTVNTVNATVTLLEGQMITVGTCGLSGATSWGDTVVNLMGPTGDWLATGNASCEGSGSNFTYTVAAGAGGNYQIRAGCFADTSCGGNVVWTISSGLPPQPLYDGNFRYAASNTNNATVNGRSFSIFLYAGQMVSLGTCGVGGSYFTGDTYLRLITESGTEVAMNNDACGSSGSHLTYTVPEGGTGYYNVLLGCFENTSCAGLVGVKIYSSPPPPPPPPSPSSGSFSYSASNTSSAIVNTVNHTLTLTAGQRLTVATCGMSGASFTGDTYLRLYGLSGMEVASNDDACGGGGSSFTYIVPSGGDYQVHAGCYSSSSCSGTVAWVIE